MSQEDTSPSALSHPPKNSALTFSGLPKHKEPLQILSWNIHDGMSSAEGPKMDDDRFSAILKKSTIFCLQETKMEINIADYKCQTQLRKGSRSGGVCIGIHKSVADNFRDLETGCQDIQAITTKTCSKADDLPLTIINVYDSDEKSAYKARRKSSGEVTITTLELLMDFIAKNTLGKIFLAGDFNARTKNINHEIADMERDTSNEHRSEPAHNIRTSKDSIINKRGRLFLDFIASTNITLLNGNSLGDIFGEFTSVNYNGSSVVDYMAVSSSLTNNVISFQVGQLTSFSDHKPCVCTLDFRHEMHSGDDILDRMEDAPLKYKWENDNQQSENLFLQSQDNPEVCTKLLTLQKTKCESAEDVMVLNNQVVGMLKDLADNTLVKSKGSIPKQAKKVMKRKRGKIKPKNPWFDSQCINSKRELNRLANSYGKSPTDDNLRLHYYRKRREHKKLLKTKKSKFIYELSQDIAEGKNISWSRFKKLKKTKNNPSQLDAFDMVNFCQFFKKLYKDPTLPAERIKDLQLGNSSTELEKLHTILDEDITLEELECAIKHLKPGKAVAEDSIANEFLKSSRPVTRATILHLFNECLRIGAYPWNTSLVTPLHKKGSLHDPNNYRAIAVASNIGKLFSSILLQRLISFRKISNADTKNQLGFCKEAQTSDHILTLTTCINKYLYHNNKGRVYACFVDYAKAFDTVCREALLYKLWHIGIQGRFFRCLDFMYSNSTAKVRLLSKLSEKIEIHCGTEQGHPMSPELFKCFINDLSEKLNKIPDNIAVPLLDKAKVSHLLWADDLVLLALDAQSLQHMLNILHTYCIEWGLSVNLDKTAVMVFNKASRLLKDSHGLTYGNNPIPSVREYCYLGIAFTLNGSLNIAQQKLKQKGMRSYFSLKSMIDIRPLKRSIIFKLFDSLILPIASYGCQVWFTETWFVKNLTENATGSLLTPAAKDPIERIHLSFLKWNLGVGSKTSNAAVWGDTGRHPLVVKVSKQVLSYFERVKSMATNNDDCLVKHAFKEQKNLNMSWYRRLSQLKDILQSHSETRLNYPSQYRARLMGDFEETWQREKLCNRKLGFYNSIKSTFEAEKYIDANLSHKNMKRIAQLRTSSHKYSIETGRYGSKHGNVINRICDFCCTEDKEALELLKECPFFDPIIEDEWHVLNTCPRYSSARSQLKANTLEHMKCSMGLAQIFMDNCLIRDLARFTKKCHSIKFPENAPNEKDPKTPRSAPTSTSCDQLSNNKAKPT